MTKTLLLTTSILLLNGCVSKPEVPKVKVVTVEKKVYCEEILLLNIDYPKLEERKIKISVDGNIATLTFDDLKFMMTKLHILKGIVADKTTELEYYVRRAKYVNDNCTKKGKNENKILR